MASSKFKSDIGSFYNKVDKLNCHEWCDIVHNAELTKFKFPSTVKSG